MNTLNEQIKILEHAVARKAKLAPEYKYLLSAPGIGVILGLTILLETGDIHRFAKAGNYASYCRCVGSTRTRNGKQKGKGNTKNGGSLVICVVLLYNKNNRLRII